MYLEVAPNGGRWWRFKFRFQNKEKRLSLGVYSEVFLKEAREKRDEIRKLVSNGVDPSKLRKITKADTPIESSNTFEFVALEWYLRFKSSWSPSHAKKVLQLFERDLFPWLKDAPLSEISPVQLLTVLRRIESRGALETAHRALGHCGQVLRYGVATGRASRDMTQDLRGATLQTKSFCSRDRSKAIWSVS